MIISVQQLCHVMHLTLKTKIWVMSREFCSFINPSHRAQEGGGERGGERGGGASEEECGEVEEGRGEEEEVRGAVRLGRVDGEGRKEGG
jgi:hypothetical protein